MKRSWVSILVISVFISSIANAQRSWRDAESGREYLLIESQNKWFEQEKVCAEKGMVTMDLRFLTDSERTNLLKSPELEHLHWENQVGNTQMNLLWQSADIGTYGNIYSSVLVTLKKNDKVFHTVEWKNSQEAQANTICMSVPGFWFFCNVTHRCEMGSAGGSSKEYFTTTFGDYGSTQNEAIKRAVERTQDPKYSVSEGKCSILTERTICYRTLPKL